MKRLMLVGSIWLISVGSVSAQNWAPVTLSDTFNYQADTASYITHTLWVDSVQVINGDSVFFLNRVVSACDTCAFSSYRMYLANQPQFLQRRIEKDTNGVYTFEDTLHFSIRSNANLHETWLFDSLRNLSAEVVSMTEVPVFTTVDSVKTILLSNGDSIVLSKQHGLLSFTGNNSVRYTLSGIENRSIGEEIPRFGDFFDFHTGDVLEYRHTNCSFSSDIRCDYLHEKLTILSKASQGDTLHFEALRLAEAEGSGSFGEPLYQIYGRDTVLLTFIDSASHICNQYSNQRIELSYPFMGPGPFWSRLRFKKKQTQRFIKARGYHYSDSPLQLASAFQYPGVSPDLMMSAGFNTYREYETGLGETIYNESIFEYVDEKILTGAIKNGDTIGVITPDAQLMVGLADEPLLITQARVLPNPNQGQFQVRFSAPTQQTLTFQIMGMDGRIVQQGELAAGIRETLFELNHAPAGIYVLNLGNGTKRVSYKIAVR